MTRARFTGDVGYRAYKKNLIINGGFDLWQRAISSTDITSVGYKTVDRFWTLAAGGTGTFQRTLDTPVGEGFNYAISLDASGDNNFVGATVELAAKGLGRPFKPNTDYTLSLWLKDSGATLSIYYRNIIGNGTDSVSIASTTFSNNAGWTKHVFTFNTASNVPNANNTQLGLDITALANGAKTTGWQLEEGSEATPFEYVSPQENLAACERYYQDLSGLDFTFPTNGQSNFFAHSIVHTVAMRVTPTIIDFFFTTTSGGGTLGVTAAVQNSQATRITVQTNTVDTTRAGYTGGLLRLSAEL